MENCKLCTASYIHMHTIVYKIQIMNLIGCAQISCTGTTHHGHQTPLLLRLRGVACETRAVHLVELYCVQGTSSQPLNFHSQLTSVVFVHVVPVQSTLCSTYIIILPTFHNCSSQKVSDAEEM